MTIESPSLDFKSATLYAIRVVVQHADTSDLIEALNKRMTDAGSFFENEPVVIDASRVDGALDWNTLVRALADHGLPVIGSFPIRLLPLLMAGSGFLSQRFTPTDPQQAPTMYMMNIVMLGIFYPMPSGLVLYWTVMNVLTAIQQWLAMRGDDGVVVVAEVPRKGNRR